VTSFNDDDEMHRFGDKLGLRRHVGALRKAIEACKCAFGSRRMERCDAARVTGGPRIEQIECFGATNFADDDAAWARSQSAAK
jgi:hypothetical protein